MLLPWLQEHARRDPRSYGRFLDCDMCMQTTDQHQRQLDGCGYEPPGVVPPDDWDFVGRSPKAFERGLPRVCPGYTCSLPEVVEASHAASFWRNGELTQFCDGEVATPALRDVITLLESESSCMQDWAMQNPPAKEK